MQEVTWVGFQVMGEDDAGKGSWSCHNTLQQFMLKKFQKSWICMYVRVAEGYMHRIPGDGERWTVHVTEILRNMKKNI